MPGKEGGRRNNPNATRIRWDPTPDRETRQELERRAQAARGSGEKAEKEGKAVAIRS